jgi:hypothetical protein
MRNVCGHVKPALNDILVVDSLFSLKEIMIVHHTGTVDSSQTFREVADKTPRLRRYSFYRKWDQGNFEEALAKPFRD